MEFVCRMNIEYFIVHTPHKDFLNVVLVCKNIAKSLCNYGSKLWFFDIFKISKNNSFVWYRPSKISGVRGIFLIYFSTFYFTQVPLHPIYRKATKEWQWPNLKRQLGL